MDNSIYGRTTGSRWLSQFGLYRYESAEPGKPKARKINVVIYGLIGLTCFFIFLILTTIIYHSNNKQKSIPLQPSENKPVNIPMNKGLPNVTIIKSLKNQTNFVYEAKDATGVLNVTNHTEESLGTTNDTKDYLLDDEYDEELENNANEQRFKNNTSESIEDIKNIQPEKLTLHANKFPLRFRRKKFNNKRRQTNRRQFDVHTYVPRPFDFQLNGPHPSSFRLKNNNTFDIYNKPSMTSISFPSNRQVDSIQDILGHTEQVAATSMSNKHQLVGGNPIKFTGIYRHPKQYTDLMGNIFNYPPEQRLKPQPTLFALPQETSSKPSEFKSDPFQNYKPKSPSEINLMALNHFRFAPYSEKPKINLQTFAASNFPTSTKIPFIPIFSPFPTQHEYPNDPTSLSDYENIYHALVKENKSQDISRIQNGNNRISGNRKHKPFSLMLDIYPMPDDETFISTTKKPRFRNQHNIKSNTLRQPAFPYIYNQNTQLGVHNLEQSYLNSMNFPQIQQQRLPLNYFQKPTNDHTPLLFSSNINNNYYNDDVQTSDKPGQMVVHLNLYPKRNKNNHDHFQERSSEVGEFHNEEYADLAHGRSLESDSFNSTTFGTHKIFLNTTSTPLQNNITNEVEIVRSIEIPTNITFEAVDLYQNNSANIISLHDNPVVVIETHGDNNIDTQTYHNVTRGNIPDNHKSGNSKTSSIKEKFVIPSDSVIKFQFIDAVKKQSDRDMFSELNTNEKFVDEDIS